MQRHRFTLGRRRRTTVIALTYVAVVIALTACGGDDPPSAESEATTQPATTAPATTLTQPMATVPPTTETPTTETPTTDTPTATEAPAASSAVDGLPAAPRVLYEWYPAGGRDKSIFMSDETLTAPPVQVVPEDPANAVHANWSHDGSMFTWELLRGNDTSTTWTANADGSEPTQRAACLAAPCAEMSYPTFSHDDSQLLVTQYDLADDGNWGQSHLVLVDLATGEQTVIASTADGTTSFYSATMSPDGLHVAAALETYSDGTQNVRTAADVVVVDTDPTTDDAPVRITDPALFAGYPRWHPTDDRILFASWDLDAYQGAEQSQLYSITSDGSDLTQITHVDYATTQRRPGEANWTPDGQRIIASIGVVNGGSVVDVKIAYVDPTTGTISETTTSGAMPSLQP